MNICLIDIKNRAYLIKDRRDTLLEFYSFVEDLFERTL